MLIYWWRPCCSYLCYPIMCIYVTISALKRCSVRLYLQLFVQVLMSYFRYLCLCAHGGVQHILCCDLFCLCSSFVSYVASFSGLSMFDCPFVLCILCCQFLWIVHVWLSLRLVYPMLPVSLNGPFLIVPSVFSLKYRIHEVISTEWLTSLSTSIKSKYCLIKKISHYSIDAPGQLLKVSVAYWAPTVMSVPQKA